MSQNAAEHSLTKTAAKTSIREALSECGYGRGYEKDYIFCPAKHVGSEDEDALSKHVYNDLHFDTLDEVAEKVAPGCEVDAYVYAQRPGSTWGQMQENVIICFTEDGVKYNRTNRTGEPVPLDVEA